MNVKDWEFLDYVLYTTIGLLIALLVLLIFIILSVLVREIKHPCIKSHKEMVYHPAWTQYMWSGKVMMPIFHSAYTSLDEVCDKRK